MLKWLFSSFTYLPNFIIRLPSFSSPWLVQLASKCHLAIFAFVRFLDFFSLCKESISVQYFLRDRLCIKVDLGYFDKDVLLHSFFQGKKFCNFVFSFICMTYMWGGYFIMRIFHRGQFSRGKILGEGWVIIFTGESFHRGYFHREQFSGWQFCRGMFSWYRSVAASLKKIKNIYLICRNLLNVFKKYLKSNCI